MEIFEQNPITNVTHQDWRRRLAEKFPSLPLSGIDFISIIQYLDKVPQKFYNNETFEKYLAFLEQAFSDDPVLLTDLLKEAESTINIANIVLSEINEKQIHDTFLASDKNELLDFIDRQIHYNLLRLYETPFYQFLFIVGKYRRIKAAKGYDKLDLYNVIKDLRKGEFNDLTSLYNNTVRNGIAHGKIIYNENHNHYSDKKGNSVNISAREIVRLFDQLLDACNGLSLAFKIFLLNHSDELPAYGVPIPQSILVEELKTKVGAPGWKVVNCFNSMAINDQRQLTIYIENSLWTYSHSLLYSFQTAYWAEKLTQNLDRVFLSLRCKNAKFSTGWAAFNASIMKGLRKSEPINLAEYALALENGYIFFTEKLKIPKLFRKLSNIWTIAKLNYPITIRDIKEKLAPSFFYLRETQIHVKKRFVVIQDPSVIIKPQYIKDVEEIIRVNRKKIVRQTIRYSRKQCSIFSAARYLPVKYIRLFIYDSDKRLRDLRYSGLIPELIATIEVNTSTIPVIDIIGGIPETIGKYRIVWHKRWRNISSKNQVPDGKNS